MEKLMKEYVFRNEELDTLKEIEKFLKILQKLNLVKNRIRLCF